MNQVQSHSTRWPRGLVTLLFLGFCAACHRDAQSDTRQSSTAAVPAQPSASVAVAAVPTAPLSTASAPCAGKYQGQYTVSTIKSGLTRKDGAPAKWETDDGRTLAGNGELNLDVDTENVISGKAQGALGELTLRGACDGSTMRVQLDPTADAIGQIQNAYLVANVTNAQASGTIAAATGDALIRRAGTVNLRKVP